MKRVAWDSIGLGARPAETGRLRSTVTVGIAVLLLVVFSSPQFAQDHPANEQEVDEYLLHLPGSGGPPLRSEHGTAAIRVLGDDGTGPVPIRDACVTAWTEEVEPHVISARLLAEGRTDSYGVVNLEWTGGRPHHWVVEAAGWGTSRASRYEEEVLLIPGVRRHLRILAPLGGPLSDAGVEVFHGCVHSPTLWNGRTDADGLVTFEDLPMDLHGLQLRLSAPNVRPLGPYSFPPGLVSARSTPPTLVARPGRTQRGRVVDSQGAALPGIIVREAGSWRGPVTVSDANGRFALTGLAENDSITFHRPTAPFGVRPSAVVPASHESVPLRVALRLDRPNDIGSGEKRFTLDVEVFSRWSPEATPVPADGVPVAVVRLSDGYTVRGATGGISPGQFTALVPPGTHKVTVGGGFSEFGSAVSTVTVSNSSSQATRFVLDPQPRLDCPQWEAGVRLQIPGAERVTPGPLPAEAPAVLALDRPPFVVPVEGVLDGFRSASIPRPELVEIRLTIVGEEGVGIPGDVEVFLDGGEVGLPEQDGATTFRSGLTGPRSLLVTAPGFQPERLSFQVPDTPEALDLGRVILRRSEERTFRVVDGDGRPVEGAVSGPTGAFPGEWQEDINLEEGACTIPVGPRGEIWLFRADGWLPVRFEVSSTGPTEIRLPPGHIRAVVTDMEGRALPAIGYLGAYRFDSATGVIDIHGIPDGRHPLIVGSIGHVGQIHQLKILGGERQRVDIRLRPRP